MSATRVVPDVLVDTIDGYAENRCWVEAIVGEEAARDLAQEVCVDEDGNDARPFGPAKRVFLRIRNPKADWEEQCWVPCKPSARTAVEWFEFDATDVGGRR